MFKDNLSWIFLCRLTESDEALFTPTTQNGRLYIGILSGITHGVFFSILSHFMCCMSFKLRMRNGVVGPPSDQTWILYQASTEGVVFFVWMTITLASVVVHLGAVDLVRVKKWCHGVLEMVCNKVECGNSSL